MPHLLRSITTPRTFTVGQVTFRVALGGLTLPALLFLALGDLPSSVRIPVLGTLTGGQTALVAVGVLSAIYVHEAGHVAAARAVDLPLSVVALDKAFPSVEPAEDDERTQDPRRRFWFAAGGAITDLACAGACTAAALVASDPARWLFVGYITGAMVNGLNVLPLTVSGLTVLGVGIAGVALDGPSAFAVSLVVVGMVVAIAGSRITYRLSDGDLALDAWKEWRSRREEP